MICLKNRTFAVSQTSRRLSRSLSWLLWFAWKIVLLQYHKHLVLNKCQSQWRCDLLEKSYFCSITNILICVSQKQASVVICLKNRTFAVSQTSRYVTSFLTTQLWFAWKIVLLQYHKHLFSNRNIWRRCCDLLEKSYFCSITNIISSRLYSVK